MIIFLSIQDVRWEMSKFSILPEYGEQSRFFFKMLFFDLY